jgi:hypothetical protein
MYLLVHYEIASGADEGHASLALVLFGQRLDFEIHG